MSAIAFAAVSKDPARREPVNLAVARDAGILQMLIAVHRGLIPILL